MRHIEHGIRFFAEGKAAPKPRNGITWDARTHDNAAAARQHFPYVLGQICDQAWAYFQGDDVRSDYAIIAVNVADYWSVVKLTKQEASKSPSSIRVSEDEDDRQVIAEAGARNIVDRAKDQLAAEEANLSFDVDILAYCQRIDTPEEGCNGVIIRTLVYEAKMYPEEEVVIRKDAWVGYLADHPCSAPDLEDLVSSAARMFRFGHAHSVFALSPV